MTALLPVECGACGWTGKRKPGKLVWCPKCGECAGFQPEGLIIGPDGTLAAGFEWGRKLTEDEARGIVKKPAKT